VNNGEPGEFCGRSDQEVGDRWCAVLASSHCDGQRDLVLRQEARLCDCLEELRLPTARVPQGPAAQGSLAADGDAADSTVPNRTYSHGLDACRSLAKVEAARVDSSCERASGFAASGCTKSAQDSRIPERSGWAGAHWPDSAVDLTCLNGRQSTRWRFVGKLKPPGSYGSVWVIGASIRP